MTPHGHDDSPTGTAGFTTARLDVLEASLAQLATDVHDLAVAVLPSDDDDPAAAGDSPVDPVFTSLDEWVEQYFTQVFIRPIGGSIRWCDQWTEHPEAMLRLEALWRAWETLRLDPNLGMASWLTTYADTLVPVLMGPTGPFASCQPGRHAV